MSNLKTYSDAYIEYWGEVFTTNNLRQITWDNLSDDYKGIDITITFEAFLVNPKTIIKRALKHRQNVFIKAADKAQFYPLLPKQRLVQQRLDQDEALSELSYFPKEKRKPHCVQFERNGKIFEPYKYHKRAT